MTKFQTKLLLFFILVLGGILRIYGINWDQGHSLHPDERAIVLSVVDLRFPQSLGEFFSPESLWNPDFFAYGSFPFYLLYFAGKAASHIEEIYGQYDGIRLVGRLISTIFDLGTIILLFHLCKRFFNKTIGFISSSLYAINVLPIQLAHFYAVDTMLTFFMLTTLYTLLLFYKKPSLMRAASIGIFLGLAIATKISAIVLLAPIALTLSVDFLILFFKHPHHIWLPHVSSFVKKLFKDGCVIIALTLVTFLLFEPYALIDFSDFWRQTTEQSHMTQDPFTFPYTLQYVGKTSYIYELTNIFFYGLGPVLAVLAFCGAIYFTFKNVIKNRQGSRWQIDIIIATFFWLYFLIVGRFSIGFMRYMLPLYPLFCLFAALLTYSLFRLLYKKVVFLLFAIATLLFAFILLIWPMSFIAIYHQNNTRVLATEWISKHIPHNSSLAIEHWDDSLPLKGQENYTMLTLPLYEPDTPEKWEEVNAILLQTDYIIIASNRLYTPLQKLTQCEVLPHDRCYAQTTSYYQRLFSGRDVLSTYVTNPPVTERARFRKVAEFANYPTMPLLNIPLDDQGADESFTVYDHPKVMIFQKIK